MKQHKMIAQRPHDNENLRGKSHSNGKQMATTAAPRQLLSTLPQQQESSGAMIHTADRSDVRVYGNSYHLMSKGEEIPSCLRQYTTIQ